MPIEAAGGGSVNYYQPTPDPAPNAPPVPPPTTTSAPAHQTPEDPAQAAAHDVLNTGKGSSFLFFHWGENDSARMAELVKELGKGDATYRKDLMTDLFKDDPHSFGSWFKPAVAEQLVKSGQITKEQEGQLATALADAYLSGAMPTSTGYVPNPGNPTGYNTTGKVQDLTDLDKFLIGNYYPAGATNPAVNAQNIRQFLDFMSSSNSGDVQQFRQQFAQHLINQYVLSSKVAANDPTLQHAAAGLAANLLTQDASRPDIAVNTLAQYNMQQVQTFMQAAAASDSIFGSQALSVFATNRGLNVQDIAIPNGAARIFNAVAQIPGVSANVRSTTNSKADQLAVDFATLPSVSPDMFKSSDNVNGLTLAVTAHAQAVFDTYSNYSVQYVGSSGGTNNYADTQNAQILGALLRTTLFNPNSANRGQMQNAVTSYLGAKLQELKTHPDATTSDKDFGNLEMMLASLTEGVRQGYVQQHADQAAKEQVLGLIVDVVLQAIPAGDLADKAVSTALNAAFKTQPAVLNIVNHFKKPLIDTTTGQLDDQLKEQIVGALSSKDSDNLQLYAQFSNDMLDATVNSLQSANIPTNSMVSIVQGIETAVATADGN